MDVIHQDLQPNKIIIDIDLHQIFITDISISLALSGSKATKIGVVQAKFDYMPPELMSGDNPSIQSDIYSLGLVLWELFENEQACPKGPLPVQFQWHKMKGLKSLKPHKMTTDIFNILKQMTATSPVNRPERLISVCDDWPQVVSEQSIKVSLEKAPSKRSAPSTPKLKSRKSGRGIKLGIKNRRQPTEVEEVANELSIPSLPERELLEYFQGSTPKHIRLEIFYENEKTGIYDLCIGPSILFGRDTKKCDVPVLVEPISPQHLYSQNVHYSMKISSRHFSIHCVENAAYFIDIGSANGSRVNGERALRDIKIPLSNQTIFIADVLCMTPTLTKDADQLCNVILNRQNNTPEKKHVVVNKSVHFSSRGKITAQNDSVFGFNITSDNEVRLEVHQGHKMSFISPLGNCELNDSQYTLVKNQPAQMVFECGNLRVVWITVK